MEGCIFNIQKFSLHDGPGIRSTVFFKGCNLRCKWCANPESQNMKPQLTLDREKCMGCGACIEACPAGARSLRESRLLVNTHACTLCDQCVQSCPVQAIAREGRRIELNTLLDELLKDKPFYDHSGGGVSFSGGEVLMQKDFAIALARSLHAHGVHVAIETAAAVPTEDFTDLLREIDLVLIDLKHYDSERHGRGTGLGNEQTLANLRALKASGKPFLLRIPVIPGFNDSLEDAKGFAELLTSMGVFEAELLPFHQLGERKYALLGRDYAYAGQPQLHREDLEEYRASMEHMGVHVRL